ncbi:hypothetical protein IWQ52_000618 [Labrenzia sp. EL_159]|nr:hypothetical protein [Labrenzia sp. EL_162]MBG6193116.1 hypothetical protein [Labrenzia sp. EL_159]
MELLKMTDGPWDGLREGDARRIDGKGRHDFFWVRMLDASPGLVLQLTAEIIEVRPLPRLKHLDVFYRTIDGRNCYCITLNENSHRDLFETLCLDVVKSAERAESLQGGLARAVRRTLRWHHLLRGGKNGMSLEEQRGLVAELSFLREIAERLDLLTAVEAWKGPEESAKDFELPGLFFEIKARRGAAHLKVHISSEAQLMDINGARFFLRVQDVDTSFETDGLSLKDHVNNTAALFDEDIAALDIWEQRLALTKYSPENVEEERSWHLGTTRTYEVLEGFPRLVPPVPTGVEEVSYSIRLDACSDFESKEELSSLLDGEWSDV